MRENCCDPLFHFPRSRVRFHLVELCECGLSFFLREKMWKLDWRISRSLGQRELTLPHIFVAWRRLALSHHTALVTQGQNENLCCAAREDVPPPAKPSALDLFAKDFWHCVGFERRQLPRNEAVSLVRLPPTPATSTTSRAFPPAPCNSG